MRGSETSMADLKSLLDRAVEEVDVRPGALQRVHRETARRRSRKRITALAIAVVVAIGSAAALATVVGAVRDATPPAHRRARFRSGARVVTGWNAARVLP